MKSMQVMGKSVQVTGKNMRVIEPHCAGHDYLQLCMRASRGCAVVGTVRAAPTLSLMLLGLCAP